MTLKSIINSDLENRQRKVIRDRYLLKSKKRTLAEIGKDLNLSRERVRQLEIESRNKLSAVLRIKSPHVLTQFIESIKKSGGIVTAKELTSTSDDHQLFNLLADICPDIQPLINDQHLKNGWVLKEINLRSVKLLIDKIALKIKNNNEPIIITRLKALVSTDPHYKESLFLPAIKSARGLVLTNSGLVGLKNDRQIDPRTVADKVYFALNQENKPMHFSEIAKKVSLLKDIRSVNKSTAHNELIAGEDFVLVGRGIYALKKWGYVEGTIAEVILDFLKRQETPQTLKLILKHVNKERVIKKNTVIINLAREKTIAKTEAGEYYIK